MGRSIADNRMARREAFCRRSSDAPSSTRVARGSEELPAHVVVHAENFVALAVKMSPPRSNQPLLPRDQTCISLQLIKKPSSRKAARAARMFPGPRIKALLCRGHWGLSIHPAHYAMGERGPRALGYSAARDSGVTSCQ